MMLFAILYILLLLFFFFKQKTAYERRISDWSSDVCSSDLGYHVAVEYQVDAPGFGDKASPFGGRPWREVVQFELFADHGRVSSVGSAGSPGRTFDGAGAGLRFHLPDTHGLDFRLAAAVPIGSEDASDGDDFRVWAKFGMTF